jgi:hypothetical protein
MPWDFRPKPRLVTCPCGAQFSTVSRKSVFCPACREKRRTAQKNPIALLLQTARPPHVTLGAEFNTLSHS